MAKKHYYKMYITFAKANHVLKMTSYCVHLENVNGINGDANDPHDKAPICPIVLTSVNATKKGETITIIRDTQPASPQEIEEIKKSGYIFSKQSKPPNIHHVD